MTSDCAFIPRIAFNGITEREDNICSFGFRFVCVLGVSVQNRRAGRRFILCSMS